MVVRLFDRCNGDEKQLNPTWCITMGRVRVAVFGGGSDQGKDGLFRSIVVRREGGGGRMIQYSGLSRSALTEEKWEGFFRSIIVGREAGQDDPKR